MEQIDQCIWDNRKISIGETSSETGMWWKGSVQK
jgi:hypothetical protein